jgi:hypothetical protein
VDEMLKSRLIVPSLSYFATIKNKFQLPIIDEFLDKIAKALYFTTIDLAFGFQQIRMLPVDEDKTAFKTHHGHFQFRVMSFGLTNAQATFQCLMNAIFTKYMRKLVLIFKDGILVYSKSLEEHIEHLQVVFQTLLYNKLFIKFSKCTFA